MGGFDQIVVQGPWNPRSATSARCRCLIALASLRFQTTNASRITANPASAFHSRAWSNPYS
ncbi:MAG: hypothetical protein MZU95_00770 [Desulfomicrobium escambiense]|nr:hypothetical protein [Desulfomicrobium escambiense]